MTDETAELEADPFEAALEADLAERHSVLTGEEIAAARAEARKRVTTDAKKEATKAIIAAEIRRLTLKTGDGYLDEEVYVSINLPPYADRLTIDGRIYSHGHQYKVPRHMANSMHEMTQRAWDHEADIKGESMRQKLGQWRTSHFDQWEGSARISAREAA